MPKYPARTYEDISKDTNFEYFRKKLKLKNFELKNGFLEKHADAHMFLRQKGIELSRVREHSAKLLGAGALAGTLLLTPPTAKKLPAPAEIIAKLESGEKKEKLALAENLLTEALVEVLPEKQRPLERQEEKTLEQLLENLVGIKVRATLEGEHLNTTYGFIGAEQHLRRFPGDTVGLHGKGEVLDEGMAPGLGAWGYFAPTKANLTPDLEETEKWYAVVQTLYLPNWGRRQPYLRDWYKYRKVLIVNTKNGKAVVAAIADAGPAAWTGKHYGGSPEVMSYLGGERYKKGPVLIFFADDPDNKIALGPVEYNVKMALGQI